ncbi:hypothetical protein FNV43_RR03925 [Rhamnella rubrinervis]|uniref:Lipid desaturase domain-containing protein n=1 Tax=Rhamnella rubrinervis TaxID=2594499 RepID=A0A8K0MQ36_9ROSA|nr:hypothetical protein FNV43_RR03925 [Rhamnella rubrinervis]
MSVLAQNESNTNQLRSGLRDPSDDHDDMLSTWSHRAWVATGCTTVLVSLAKSIMGAANSHIWLETILAGLFGRQFANNLHALARAASIIMLPVDLAFDDPIIHGFLGVCFGCLVFSQQFHAWAHCPKSRLPQLVVALQGHGLLVSRSQHAAHHRPPYNKNYCIVSGIWNEFLDKHKVFEKLEMVLFSKLGVRPRSWDIGPN